MSNYVVTFYDVKCKRNDKYDVWMDLWVRKHSSQSREVISVCSGQAGSTQLACGTFCWCAKSFASWWTHSSDFLSLPGWRWLSFFIIFKQRKRPKYHLVLTVQIFGIEPPLSLELELRQHMSWVPKAIIIISADGQNRRVICNIMNAPIPNFSWSFDIFCDWSSSSCKLHLHNLLWKIFGENSASQTFACCWMPQKTFTCWMASQTLNFGNASSLPWHSSFFWQQEKRDGIT